MCDGDDYVPAPRKARKLVARKKAAPVLVDGFNLVSALDSVSSVLRSVGHEISGVEQIGRVRISPDDMTHMHAEAVVALDAQLDTAMHSLARARIGMVPLLRQARQVINNPEHMTHAEYVIGIPEMWHHIMRFLDKATMNVISLVSRGMCAIARERVVNLFIGLQPARQYEVLPGSRRRRSLAYKTINFHSNFDTATQQFAVYSRLERVELATNASSFSLRCYVQLIERQLKAGRKPVLDFVAGGFGTAAAVYSVLDALEMAKVPLSSFRSFSASNYGIWDIEATAVAFSYYIDRQKCPVLFECDYVYSDAALDGELGRYAPWPHMMDGEHMSALFTVRIVVSSDRRLRRYLTCVVRKLELVAIVDTTATQFEAQTWLWNDVQSVDESADESN